MRKRAIAATMLLTAAMAFTSCAKLYEEETTETLKRPQPMPRLKFLTPNS